VFEPVAFAIASALLYHLGFGFVFFLIPQQMVYARQGRKPFLISLAVTFGLVMGIELISVLRNREGLVSSFLLIEVFVILALMGGLAAVNLIRPPRPDRVRTLIAATGATALLAVPLMLYLKGNEGFTSAIRQLFDMALDFMTRAFSQPESAAGAAAPGASGTEALMRMTSEIFLRSFAFSYFFMLCFTWWTGTQLGCRSLGKKAFITRLVDFELPEIYVWPLIASLALVLVDMLIGFSPLGVIAWNASLILLFLYGLVGIGIMHFLFAKYKLPRRWLTMLLLALGIMLIFTRLSLLVIILVPGLGISEIWLHHRKRERSESSQ
jgi:hypothetical protein